MTGEARRILSQSYGNAEAFGRLWGRELREAGAGLIERLPLGDARRVLDLGAGVGLNVPTLRTAAPSAFVAAVDLVEPMIRAVPAEVARAVMDASALAFADGSFDAVLMAFMLFHVPEPPAALAEVRRVVRTGGTVAVGTWSSDSEDSAADAIWAELLDELGAPPPDPIVQRHEMMDSPEKLAGLLRDAGFDEVATTTRALEDAAAGSDEFIERRTCLGFSRRRFESLGPEERRECLARARERLAPLGSDGFVAREASVYAWAR